MVQKYVKGSITAKLTRIKSVQICDFNKSLELPSNHPDLDNVINANIHMKWQHNLITGLFWLICLHFQCRFVYILHQMVQDKMYFCHNVVLKFTWPIKRHKLYVHFGLYNLVWKCCSYDRTFKPLNNKENLKTRLMNTHIKLNIQIHLNTHCTKNIYVESCIHLILLYCNVLGCIRSYKLDILAQARTRQQCRETSRWSV